ncbi:MAG: CopD family protein [Halorhabdus sp.]
MELIEALVTGVHLLFASLWTGSVLFVTLAILPIARDGTLDSAPLARLTDRFVWITRTSVFVTLLSGAHQAMALTVDGLFETTRGHLVIGMVVLWLALAALSEIAASRLADGTAERKVRTPAANARPFLLVASILAVLLLFDAGALAVSW